MDYSAAISDDPAAASPWGSSSPRAQRGPFTGATPDSPTTPSRTAQTEAQTALPEPALPTTEPQPEIAAFNGHHAHSDQLGPPIQTHQQSEQQYQGQTSVPSQQSQQRPGAARYHSARQQRPVPQYKLQAKVTALERTGRKDPVLRFDVYVWRSFEVQIFTNS